MQSKMKRVFLLTMVCMLILTTFVGCATPKKGDVYKATDNSKGEIIIKSGSTFTAKGILLEIDSQCFPIPSGTGTYRIVGKKTIYFKFSKVMAGLADTDELTATINSDGSFTACGTTYKKAK